MGKGEIARYKQFPLFPTMFSKAICLLMHQNEYLWSKGLRLVYIESIHRWKIHCTGNSEDFFVKMYQTDRKGNAIITFLPFAQNGL